MIYSADCGAPNSATVTITADGVDEPVAKTRVFVRFSLNKKNYGPIQTAYHSDSNTFQVVVGNFSDVFNGPITFDIYALDSAGLESAHNTSLSISYVGSCPIG